MIFHADSFRVLDSILVQDPLRGEISSSRLLGQGFDPGMKGPDQLQSLLLLVCYLLELKKRCQDVELDPQGMEDRHGRNHRFLDLSRQSQLDVDRGQVRETTAASYAMFLSI